MENAGQNTNLFEPFQALLPWSNGKGRVSPKYVSKRGKSCFYRNRYDRPLYYISGAELPVSYSEPPPHALQLLANLTSPVSPTPQQITAPRKSCPSTIPVPTYAASVSPQSTSQKTQQFYDCYEGLFPLREVPSIGCSGDVVNLRQYTFFTPQDIKELTDNVPTFEEEPYVVMKKMADIYFQYSPSYKDVENLLKAFLTECEKNKIMTHFKKARGHGAAHYPSQDPEWDYNKSEDYLQLYHCREAIINAMWECSKSTAAWAKFESLKQSNVETPSQFLDRLIELGGRNLAFDLFKERDIRQIKCNFV